MTKNPPTRKAPVAAAVTAAIAGAVETIMLSPALIVPSPTNPRKTFPEESLQELAASMKADGQVQSITIRPLPASRLQDTVDMDPRPTHELVVGERRWRAATLGGLDLRCEVRDLTDLQVVRIQIIENLHREEVHPLEEAEGYEYLLHHSSEKITAVQVAAEVGKSVSYVFQRLKLCELCPDARKAFYAGDFDASTALLVARMPTPGLQLKAIDDIKRASFNADQAPSYRQIRAMLRQRYHLQLAVAPFDITDGTLVEGCGNCVACPKRTGNQPQIFEDVDSADVCTDPDCFDSKRKASVARTIEKARAEGMKVIDGDDARGIASPHYSGKGFHYIEDHVDLNDEAFKDTDGNSVTFADLVEKAGKKAPEQVLLAHPDSLPTKLISDEAAQQLLKKFLPKELQQKNNSQRGSRLTPEQEAEEAARRREHAVRSAYRDQLQGALLARTEKPRTHQDMVLIVCALAGEDLEDDLLEAAGAKMPDDPEAERDFDYEGAFVTALLEMQPAQLAAFALRLAVDGSLVGSYYAGQRPLSALEAAVQSHGIKLDAMRKQAEKKAEKELAGEEEETDE